MKLSSLTPLFGLPLVFAAYTTNAAENALTVYKSPSCGCCTAWIDHMKENGYEIDAQHPIDLSAVKRHFQVSEEHRSCHTAVTEEGMIFEGHVPAKFVDQFLASPPEGAIGLSVPEMPVGTPGMEMGDRFTPYQVVQMNRDGTSRVYAVVTEQDSQY